MTYYIDLTDAGRNESHMCHQNSTITLIVHKKAFFVGGFVVLQHIVCKRVTNDIDIDALTSNDIWSQLVFTY